MGKASRARREKVAEFIQHQERENVRKHECFYDRWLNSGSPKYSWLSDTWGNSHEVFDITNVWEYCHRKAPEFFSRKGEPLDYDLWIDLNQKLLIDCRLPYFDMFFYWKSAKRTYAATMYNGIAASDWDKGDPFYIEFGTFFEYRAGSGGIQQTNSCRVMIDADGTNVAFQDIGSNGGTFANDDPITEGYIARDIAVVFAAITLMNCRGIEIVEHVPTAEVDRKYQEYYGKLITRHKTLAISPVRKVYDYERGERQPVLGLMPEHLVRGNPARYTDAAPLFGKYVRTVWRPAHVRGNPKRGRVLKDYKVKAPNDN